MGSSQCCPTGLGPSPGCELSHITFTPADHVLAGLWIQWDKALWCKFTQHPNLLRDLLATGNAEIKYVCLSSWLCITCTDRQELRMLTISPGELV